MCRRVPKPGSQAVKIVCADKLTEALALGLWTESDLALLALCHWQLGHPCHSPKSVTNESEGRNPHPNLTVASCRVCRHCPDLSTTAR